ncbi:MAG: cysteine desulfurase family protein [Planctomycetota bacterium]
MVDPARIHLDFNATGPVDPRVLARFLEVETTVAGNPSSLHSAGRRARLVLEDARLEAAQALGVEPDAIVFLSGGTEANHLAIRGLGELGLPVACADSEHRSVLAAASARGVVWWPTDSEGRARLVEPGVPLGMLALAHAQGEVGSLQPVALAAGMARDLSIPLHVDAAQTLGRVDLREVVSLADSVALATHKAGGLRGCSVLVVRRARPRAWLTGGGQESGLRSGTVSVSLAAATARAIRLAVAETDQRAAAMRAARDALVDHLRERVALRLLTPVCDVLPNTALILFEGLDGRALLPALDLAGIEASAGSACSSGSPQPPAVLRSLGLDDEQQRACIRLATSASTEVDHARVAAERIAAVVDRLRAARARTATS